MHTTLTALLLLAIASSSHVHGKSVEVVFDWSDVTSKSAQEAVGGLSRTVSADDSLLFLFTPGPGLAVRRLSYEEYSAGMQKEGAGCRPAAEVAAEEAAVRARLDAAAATAAAGGSRADTAFAEDELDEAFDLALAAEGAAAGWLQLDLGDVAAGEVLYFGTAASDAGASTTPPVCFRAKIRVGRAKSKAQPQCLSKYNADVDVGSKSGGGGGGADSDPEEVKHNMQAALLNAVYNPQTKAGAGSAGSAGSAGADKDGVTNADGAKGRARAAPPTVSTVDLMYSGLFVASTVAGSGPPHNVEDGDRDCAHIDKGYTAPGERRRSASSNTAATDSDSDAAAGGVNGVVDVAGPDAKLSYPGGTAWVGGDTNAVLVSESGCAAATYANDRLSLIQPSGRTTVVAGGVQGYRDGVGEAARFRHIAAVATTPDGTLAYIADMGNNCIRRLVLATGVVTTVAGLGHDTEYELPGGHKDGTVDEARFWHPEGIALDPRSNTLYVSDTDNHRIRAIDLRNGIVTTVAGHGRFGSIDGRGAEARFKQPSGIAIDLTANVLYVADAYNHRVRHISLPEAGGNTAESGGGSSSSSSNINSQLRVQTLAGSVRGHCDGSSPFTTLFDLPAAIAVDPLRHVVYVADTLAQKIRAVGGVGHPSPGSAVTISGVGTVSESSDQVNSLNVGLKDGSQDVAEYNHPAGLAVSVGYDGSGGGGSSSSSSSSNAGGGGSKSDGSSSGNMHSMLYVTDQYNHRLRSVAVPFIAKSSVQYNDIEADSLVDVGAGVDGAEIGDGNGAGAGAGVGAGTGAANKDGETSTVDIAAAAATIGIDQAAEIVGGHKILAVIGAIVIISVVWSNFAAAGTAAGREKDD